MRKTQTGQYKHVTLEERITIYSLKSLGKSLRVIAKEVSRDVGTISRELKRNKSRCDMKYFPTCQSKIEMSAFSRLSSIARRPARLHG